jgi:hypothetical protein
VYLAPRGRKWSWAAVTPGQVAWRLIVVILLLPVSVWWNKLVYGNSIGFRLWKNVHQWQSIISSLDTKLAAYE